MNKKAGRAKEITKLELLLSGLVLVGSLTLISYVFSVSGGTRKHSSSASPRVASGSLGGLSGSTAIDASAIGDSRYAAKTKRSRHSCQPADAAPNAIADVPSEETDSSESEVSTPVAFVDPSPGQALTEEQVTEFDFMRQEFVELMGGPNQDPADPQYLLRWEYAQQQLDDEFRAFFGVEAFNQQQLEAVSVAGQQPVGPRSNFSRTR
jgi:hypothetical protein